MLGTNEYDRGGARIAEFIHKKKYDGYEWSILEWTHSWEPPKIWALDLAVV